ncbi:MAG TPA: glycosyltransferase [Chthoniobacterales bacterium]|nr:glycosyltransferase [Chthoniobacterales bacterium]
MPHDRVIIQPNGLNESERAALAAAMQPVARRLQQKEICFVGMWGLRKGSRDWPEIVRQIRSKMPEVKFKFLGTMVSKEMVLTDLGVSESEGIFCLGKFDRNELPNLLSGCAVGLFPSYIEGFGLSVIEQLAAGIPTIAYDVPGPRQIFTDKGWAFLVPMGDVGAMVESALEVLRMSESEYSVLSEASRRIADTFRWEKIAADTVHEYQVALEQMTNPPG